MASETKQLMLNGHDPKTPKLAMMQYWADHIDELVEERI